MKAEALKTVYFRELTNGLKVGPEGARSDHLPQHLPRLPLLPLLLRCVWMVATTEHPTLPLLQRRQGWMAMLVPPLQRQGKVRTASTLAAGALGSGRRRLGWRAAWGCILLPYRGCRRPSHAAHDAATVRLSLRWLLNVQGQGLQLAPPPLLLAPPSRIGCTCVPSRRLGCFCCWTLLQPCRRLGNC